MKTTNKCSPFSYRLPNHLRDDFLDLVNGAGFSKAKVIDKALAEMMPHFLTRYAQDIAEYRRQKAGDVSSGMSALAEAAQKSFGAPAVPQPPAAVSPPRVSCSRPKKARRRK